MLAKAGRLPLKVPTLSPPTAKFKASRRMVSPSSMSEPMVAAKINFSAVKGVLFDIGRCAR